MKFQKRNARLKYYARFNKLTSIRAFTQVPVDDTMFLCGDYNNMGENDAPVSDALMTYTAGVARMRMNGDVQFFLSLTGISSVQGKPSKDRCTGI